MSLGPGEYAARAAAYERCAAHLDGRNCADANEAIADAWLAKRLRTEAESLTRLANAVAIAPATDQELPFVPIPGSVGKPLTDRMVESLVEMKRGTKVESEEFFAWPGWKHEPGAKYRSLGCCSKACNSVGC